MPRTAMVYNSPTLKLATSEGGLTTGQAVECQVNSARVEATANYQTIPATGCAGATQSPGLDSWALNLTYLDDWSKGEAASLSWFSYENSGKQVWFELVPDKDDPTVGCTGSAFAVSGGIGGTFGDGSSAQTTSTWPCVERPDIVVPA